MRQSSEASRSAVLAPTPRPGVMVCTASPISVTLEGVQGSSGTEVRMTTGNTDVGSDMLRSFFQLGCHLAVCLRLRASKDGPSMSRKLAGYLSVEAQTPQLM